VYQRSIILLAVGNFLTTEDFAQGLTILADGSLRLSSAQISDEGLYSCVARNEAGFSQKSIQLNVFGRYLPTQLTILD